MKLMKSCENGKVIYYWLLAIFEKLLTKLLTLEAALSRGPPNPNPNFNLFMCFHMLPHENEKTTPVFHKFQLFHYLERTHVTRHPCCICDKWKHPISFKESQSCFDIDYLTTWKEYLPYRFPNTGSFNFIVAYFFKIIIMQAGSLQLLFFVSLNIATALIT